MARIRDIAKVCRSKNAGPFQLTLDIVFDDAEVFRAVEASGVLNAELIAKLYGLKASEVLFTPYPPALAFKATIPRLVPAGDFGDTDVYGSQQHAPLLDIEIPL
jgi:hypothetical protein